MTNSFLIIVQSNFTSVILKNILSRNHYNVTGEMNLQMNESSKLPEYLVVNDKENQYKIKVQNGIFIDAMIDYIEEKKPTVLFIDTDLFSSELFDKLREKDILSVIILMSPMGQQYMALEGLKLGANTFVIKPFSEKYIIKEIKSIVG